MKKLIALLLVLAMVFAFAGCESVETNKEKTEKTNEATSDTTKSDAEQVSLEEIFSTCDIVSVHSAMTEKTKGMIGKKHFDLLKDGALFVNTARGGVIKEEEMIEALKENRFTAVLDVYYNEPLEPDSALRYLPNVIPFPHAGGPTIDRRSVVTMRIADVAVEMEKNPSYVSEYEVDKVAASRMTVGK